MTEPYAPGSNEWWTVRRVANGDATRPWYELTDEDRAALNPPRIPAMTDLTAAVERLTMLAAGCDVAGLDHLPVVSRENAKPFAADIRLVLSALQRQEGATSLDRMIEPAPEVWVRFADNGGIRMWKATPFDGAHRYALQPTSGASDVQR
jgi:hypothetical protein